MKLVELLARKIDAWPEPTRDIAQGKTGNLYNEESDVVGFIGELAEDHVFSCVARAQWEAERDRIAKEDSLAHLASLHKHEAVVPDAAEDSAFMTELARDIFRDLAKTCADFVQGGGTLVDDAPSKLAEDAFNFADAFMQERAKRMKGKM